MNAHQATSLPATSFASHKVLLFATLLLALLLRMYQIEQPFNSAFAWRQCSTAMMAENFYKGNWNILFPEVNWVGPGPGYQGREFQLVTYLAALLYRIFGQEEWVGRLVVISFSILGVFSLYQLVKRVWDEHHALAAAFVLAILPGSVYIDRSFLPDPAMVSLVIASLWQWITFLQTEKRKHLLVAAILACLGFLTKITGMIVCIPIIYAAFTALKSRGWPLKELKLIALTTSCVLVLVGAYYSWARYLSQTYPPYHFAGEGNWLWNFEPDYWITKRYFFERNFFHLKSRLWGLPFLLLAIVGISLRQNIIPGEGNIESPSGRKFKYLFHFWLLGCLIFYIIGARELSFNPWNFHIFSPAIAAFSGRALVAAFFFGSNRAKRLLTLTVILL